MQNSAKKLLVIGAFLSIFAALLITFYTNNREATNLTAYRAPLHNYDHPGRVPGYMVLLRPGYSLAAHDSALAIPLNPLGRKVLKNISERVMYYVEVDDKTLDTIRADPGVEMVECNYRQNALEKKVANNEVDS
jgi:hypothetical protein